MSSLVRYLFCCLFIAALHIDARAQNSSVKVVGEVTTPLDLSKSDLSAFDKTTAKVKDRDGKEHVFAGAALIDVLKKAGVTTGAQLRGENLTKYVLIQAADGYEVAYALAEIDPEFTDQTIILATEKDGQPLANGEGPFRIISTKDKKPARWVREVRTIKVLFAKE